MIEISVDTRRAVVTNKEILTSGSAGIQVQFTLSEDWTGLSKLAVFRTGEDGESIDVVLDNNLNCVVPAEALETADEVLFIGVYGSDGNGTVIIPTIWAAAGVIRPGTEPNTPAEAEPTPEIWAQILSVAQEAETTATGAMNYVEQAVSDLGTLEDRVSDNEEDRVAAEQARASAEDTRAEAETARITNEDSRISAESNRNTAEVARSMAETARADAEAARVTAEQGRVTAENARVAAEAIREEKYAEYVETVSGYADDAEASAEAARTSMINAQNASGSASQSATSANNSATTATSKANEASSWASTALNAAGNAAGSQSAAAQSATAAAASQTAAETAQAAAEAAQSAAEDAQDAAEAAQTAAETAASSISGKSEQIDQNTSDISDLSRQLSDVEENQIPELKSDLSDLNSAIDGSLELTYEKVNLVTEIVDNKYPTGSVGGRLSFVDSDSHGYAVAPVEGGKPYSVPLGLSDNFSYWVDSSGIVVLKGVNSVKDTSYQGYVYIAPSNAATVYIANLHGYLQRAVVLQTTESLVGKTTSDYPIEAEADLIQVEIPKLVAGTNKVNLDDFVDETVPPYYSNINDKLDNIVSSYSFFGIASISGNVVTVNDVNGGLATNHFTSNTNMVRIKGNITFTTPNLYWQIAYYNGTRWIYLKKTSLESGVDFEVSFDAANLVVYSSAEEFYIIFNTVTEDGVSDYTGTITVNELSVNELTAFQQSEYYDENFEPMMQKVFTKLDEGGISPQVNTKVELTSISGEKYLFGIGANDDIVLIPKVPNKTLFCGNSLLLGMNTTSTNKQYVYGMCATAPENDYCHKVMTAINGQKQSATYERVHGAAFEQLGSNDSFSTLWNTTANVYTGEPLKNSFTSDLNLIIIQLSDNVNSDDRRTALSNNIDAFIGNIRNASPNARIIWVHSWFYNATTANIIETACERWGIETVNIRSLNTTANQATSGQTFITGNGGTATVSDTWITHPGDTGMEAIANSIIERLGI